MRIARVLYNSAKSLQKVLKNDLNIVNEDRYLIRVKAGSGGVGISRYNGVGGRGGDVYLVGKPDMAFSDVRKGLGRQMRIRAANGPGAQKIKLVAEDAPHTYMDVPVGVEAVDEEQNRLVARVSRPFKRYLIASGGEGGNARNQYKPSKGDEFTMALHLKLRPNIGLVGFPNAGKSTLLKAFLPKKSVKIAAYPFTTVKPQVGFWNPDNREHSDFTLTIADLPGLIEGAAANRGRGHSFLKHVQHCSILLLVVDCRGFQLKNELNEPYRSALESVALLNRELEQFDPALARKPAVLLINKIDIAQEDPAPLVDLVSHAGWQKEVSPDLRPSYPLHFDRVLAVSAKKGDIDDVKKALLRVHRSHNSRDVPDQEHDERKMLV